MIVPVYNEEKVIHGTLRDLLTRHHPDEVLVVDGGSSDRTVERASEWTKVIRSEKGRARQMNEGVRQAGGDVFLFLHADTKLPPQGLEKIKETISHGTPAGRFRIKFDDPHPLLRFYASYSRLHFFSYGDQGFFLRREIFERLGGFREEVPFEDIDFYSRLRRVTRPAILRESVVTSARRFSGVGRLRQKMINIFLVTLYYAGRDVLRLKERLYPEVR